MKKSPTPLFCDPVTGICEIPEQQLEELTTINSQQKNNTLVKVLYFTDPICSSCWGLEPQLRRLKLEFGNQIEIEYIMGGLLPDWSYNSGGISKPSDVAEHWDEVSEHYDMPIDGNLWLEDPLQSSYPPSIAFKAAQLQNKGKSSQFLREIRELVFLKKKNISKYEHLEYAAEKVGLNIEKFKIDFHGKAREDFEKDLKLAKEHRIKGFPTVLFQNKSGDQQTVYGSKPYDYFQAAIQKSDPSAVKKTYDKNWKSLFNIFSTLTLREYSELSGISRTDSSLQLDQLTENKRLKVFTTRNGSIWSLTNSTQ